MMDNKLELVAGVLTFPEIELPKVERVSFLTPLPPLRESFAQFLERQKAKTKYHRKTNYKPKYTL